MNRRDFLATLGIAGAALSGCLDAPTRAGETGPSAPGTDTGTSTPGETASRTTDPGVAPVARHGLPGDICSEERGDDPGIYAVDEPAFGEDWSDRSFADRYGRLEDDTPVVGIERDGDARAYPVPVLWYHEIVNDDLGGPLLVTYCPLCKSGLVAERRVGGVPTDFLVSGLLWKPPALQVEIERDEEGIFGADRDDPEARARRSGNLVMYDRATGSYWSQLIAQAICGPQAGTELGIAPSTVATWADWRARYPNSTVLLPPPHSGTVAPRA